MFAAVLPDIFLRLGPPEEVDPDKHDKSVEEGDDGAESQAVMTVQRMEILVDHKGDFVETTASASGELRDYFRELDVALPHGFRTEVNLDAVKWIQELALKDFFDNISF